MRVVVQRVRNAQVDVPETGYSASIGHGLLLLVAFIDEDTEEDLDWTARKIAAMRIGTGLQDQRRYRGGAHTLCHR